MLLAKALKARLVILTDVNGVLNGKGKKIKLINNIIFKKLILHTLINMGNTFYRMLFQKFLLLYKCKTKLQIRCN